MDLLKELILNELAAWKKRSEDIQWQMNPWTRLGKWHEVPDVYFHFTNGYVLTVPTIKQGKEVEDIKKVTYDLSTNINTKFSTPVGIYAYPSSMIDQIQAHKIPYGLDRKYIIVFRDRTPARTVKVSMYSKGELYQDIKKLNKMYGSDTVSNIIERGIINNKDSNAGILWGLTYFLTSEDNFFARGLISNPKAWYILFRRLGYTGFVDDLGLGIIHENEPTQAVFFGEGVLDTLDYIKNPMMDSPGSFPIGKVITNVLKNPSSFKSVINKIPPGIKNSFMNDLVYKMGLPGFAETIPAKKKVDLLMAIGQDDPDDLTNKLQRLSLGRLKSWADDLNEQEQLRFGTFVSPTESSVYRIVAQISPYLLHNHKMSPMFWRGLLSTKNDSSLDAAITTVTREIVGFPQGSKSNYIYVRLKEGERFLDTMKKILPPERHNVLKGAEDLWNHQNEIYGSQAAQEHIDDEGEAQIASYGERL